MATASKSRVLGTIPILIAVCFVSFPVQAQYGGGTGELNDPYLIYTAEQMNQIGLHEEDWDKHFTLMADIDLSAYKGTSFNLIGSYDSDWVEKSFTGVFKGNGHVISGFTYHGDSLANVFFVGLFRSVDGVNARIQDLRLIDPNVSGGRYIGALVGRLHNGTISNCVIEAGVVVDSEGSDIGGIVGANIQGILLNCRSERCVVHGRSHVGGLIGKNEGTIQNCYSSGDIFGNLIIGGQVGDNLGSIYNTYSTSRVRGSGSMQLGIGGLVGLNIGTIEACCAAGDVTGIERVGGLIGNNNDNSIITDSYATGNVSGDSSIGGLVGNNNGGTIFNSYAGGSIDGNDLVGGLVGSSDHTSVISASFWDVEASGQETSAGGTGKTTAEMQTANIFLEAGWDFVDETANGTDDIWWIIEGQDYPRLWWQYGRAFAPYPQDGATDIVPQLLLSWAPGGYALQHDVYFGEDEQTVADATTESLGIYRGRQAAAMTTYDPGSLELFKTYYWRIDEVNDANHNNLPKGKIWSFTTADFIVVDDFESYKDHDNEVWCSWYDGLGFGGPPDGYLGNGTGSAVGDETWMGGGHMETVIVHSGRQSMPYSYDNDKQGFAKYSEAEKTLIYPRDWTEESVEVLSLWIYGDPVNAPEPMYVAVADSNGPTAVVVYHDNPDAALIHTWTEWTIDLQDFADQGVNLTDVNSITIGFCDRTNLQPGGSGRMYFDDIRLYRLLP